VTTAATASCPSAVTVERLQSARTIRADLGGNGRLEQARVVRSKDAPSQCRWFVVVRSATRTASIPLPRTLVALGRPELFGVVRLGGDRRREIVVRSNLGANTEAFALYAFERGAIKRVRIAVRGSHDLLYAGAGGSLLAVACLDRGPRHVVASEAVSNGVTVRVDRHMFRLAGDRLVQTSSQKLTNANPKKLPEFRGAERLGIRGLAFSGCDLRLPGK
jgi:hypothetical protein